MAARQSLTEGEMVQLDEYIVQAENHSKKMPREIARCFRKAMLMARVPCLAREFREALDSAIYEGAGGGTWPAAEDAALDAALDACGENEVDTLIVDPL